MSHRFCVAMLVLVLNAGLTLAQDDQENESKVVAQTLQNYAAAVQSKDMTAIEKYVVTNKDFTVFEGGHINWGWVDFRDHHLAPELKEFLEFQYGYQDIKTHLFGDVAYATLKYDVAIKTKERKISFEGLATVVLTKQNAKWKVRHIHTSRIPKHEH